MQQSVRPMSEPALLLHDRYRRHAPPDDGPWNEVLATLLGHRSVRAFLPTPVADATLSRLVAAAQSASSSSNLQVWSVIAVRDPARKARLAKAAANQKHMEEAPLLLVWLADLSRIRRIATSKQRTLAGADYLEAFMTAVIDVTLAAQNAAIAAESLGLGIVYIGGLRSNAETVIDELALPPGVFAVFGMCVGYPDPARPADVKPRLPQQAMLHAERYDPRREAETIAAYEVVQREFRAEQGLPPIDWSDQSTGRWGTVEALRGRERLVEILRAHGFPLR
jgi:nitroreductase